MKYLQTEICQGNEKKIGLRKIDVSPFSILKNSLSGFIITQHGETNMGLTAGKNKTVSPGKNPLDYQFLNPA